MAKRKSQKTRTRTITKFKTRTRNVFAGVRSRSKSKSTKADHVVLLTTGAGAGALTTTVLQIARKNGVKIPQWVDLLASGITGFLAGKHVSKNNMKALESALSSVATSYVENKVVSGLPILNLQLNGNGSSQNGVVIY